VSLTVTVKTLDCTVVWIIRAILQLDLVVLKLNTYRRSAVAVYKATGEATGIRGLARIVERALDDRVVSRIELEYNALALCDNNRVRAECEAVLADHNCLGRRGCACCWRSLGAAARRTSAGIAILRSNERDESNDKEARKTHCVLLYLVVPKELI
jgi:hypothetical protein